ncbi:MAG TPA: DoxX family protein [Puia sp.]|nr:DoxX family protein [Puia sp.]
MKKTNILYWTFTSLFAFFMLGSAIPDVFSAQTAVEGFSRMSMPPYLIPFLGVAKTLGVIAILIPGYPRIKEWAYAGLVFDLLGATWCVFSSGVRDANLLFMFIPLTVGFLSYACYHRRLAYRKQSGTSIPFNIAIQ